jgi:DNA-binding response OmpR family regulator
MTVKKTILCVDDEQSLSIQKLTLETRGYRVVTCNTAVEAISFFNHRGVDLVLSNFELPDAHATDLAKRIKALAPETPVVLVGSQNWAFHSDAPVDLLLRKGTYAPADLLERIRLLLVKRRGPRRSASAALASRGRVC